MREVPHTRGMDFLEAVRPAIDHTLDQILPTSSTPPSRIHNAMRYSACAGGKRLRPSLCVAAYSAFQDDWHPVLPVAAALELIHTYSLIHDDLPAMDDDDFRRGQPSCHRQFGESTAILAGDALLTLAFEVLAAAEEWPCARLQEVTLRIARAAGSTRGMIAGQVMDLEAEGGAVATEHLKAIHLAKTGALIEASLASGALLGGAPADAVRAVEDFGRSIGLAFQVTDDILDEVAEAEALGKTPGKDMRQGKATYPGLYGLDASYREVRRLTGEARQSLAGLGSRAKVLVGIADHLETRTR